MKDHEARDGIVILTIARKKHETEVALLREQLALLQERFDALFDAVAEDLGYEAARIPTSYLPPFLWSKVSPRRLGTTAPVPGKIVRNPTARCKRKTTP